MKLLTSIEEIRDHFPALKQVVNSKPIVYIDNAATAQKPQCVTELVNRMNSGINGNIHRAVHELSVKSTQLYEEARDEIRSFINAESRDEIVFTSGSTASINLIANSFTTRFINKGDAVLITEAEHHSNIVPWQMACERSGANLFVLPVDEDGNWEMDKLEELLENRVKIVSVAHISNVLGILNPVEELIRRAHKMNIPVLIDGAQGVVHTEVDVQRMGCDFYVFSGHKLYGPTGTGVLYGKRSLLEEMPPWLGGGDMVATVSFAGTTYAGLPLKFEAGTPDFIAVAGLGEAIRFIRSVDMNIVSDNENSIVTYLNKALSEIDGVKIFGKSANKIALFSIDCRGAHATDLAMLLNLMGIALRSGQMCSEPLMEKYGLTGMLRASFVMYNTLDEAKYFIDSLVCALGKIR